jgi:hypothetical protein
MFARSLRPTLPEQVVGELGRRVQGDDCLLHELEPLDRPKPDDGIAGELDRDRMVRPGSR